MSLDASLSLPPIESSACTDAACFHCGQPLPARPFTAVVASAPRAFCCAGCLAVAHTIHEAGLDRFYAARTATASKPPDRERASEWMQYEAAAAGSLVRELEGRRREASLLLEGVSCGACTWLIESWLARQPGVERVRVNFSTRRADVVWRSAEASLATLLRAVANIGYTAHPYDPKRREALALSERRSLLARMAVAVLAMMQVMMFAVPAYVTSDGIEAEASRLLDWASFTLALPVLAYSAAPIFAGAWRGMRMRSLGMDVPVALGLAAAFAASAWSTLGGGGPVYYDSVTMFVALLLVARYVELVARQRAGDAIEAVARHRPEIAERLGRWPQDRTPQAVAAAALAAGEHVLVRPGAVVPADGEVVEGRSHVEEAVLTGESKPRELAPGDAVLAGAVNGEGPLVVRVRAAGSSTRLAAVLRLTGEAANARPRMALLADRAASAFVVALLGLAAITALAWWHVDPSRALAATFALLVVSCPCALSLATPSALAAAAGALSRRQVVLAQPDALETLARVTHVVFDKTGTLTSGRLGLQATFVPDRIDAAHALSCAAALEAASEHSIGRALVAAGPVARYCALDVIAVAGRGIEGTIDGVRYRIGSPRFASELGGSLSEQARAFIDSTAATSTVVALASVSGMHALFALGDVLRADASETVGALRSAGLTPVLMSGDRTPAAQAFARRLDIHEAFGDQSPADKMDAIAAMQARGAVVAMIGDGVNDAPGLARADVSISLGSATAVAQWNADVVVLCDELSRIADAIAHAKRTRRVVRQNLGWAFAYNITAIPAAALGFVSPLAAAVGMSLSSLAVVLNALRAGRIGGRAWKR